MQNRKNKEKWVRPMLTVLLRDDSCSILASCKTEGASGGGFGGPGQQSKCWTYNSFPFYNTCPRGSGCDGEVFREECLPEERVWPPEIGRYVIVCGCLSSGNS